MEKIKEDNLYKLVTDIFRDCHNIKELEKARKKVIDIMSACYAVKHFMLK